MTDAETRTRTDRLANPVVHAKIRAALPGKVQPADADDIVQKVFLRLLLIPELPPTLDRLLGLVVVVTRRVALDHFRSTGRRLRKEADVDDHAELLALPEPEVTIDEAEQIRLALDHVDELFASGRAPETMVVTARLLAEGKSTTEIAALTGRSVAAVKMEASRVRKHLRAYWGQYLAGSIMLLAFVIFATHRRTPVDFTIGPDITAVGSSSATPTSLPGASNEGPWPVGLRGDAARLCEAHSYAKCEKALDDAKKLDPNSDSLLEVKAMRAEIAKWKAEGSPSALPPPPPAELPKGPGKPPGGLKP